MVMKILDLVAANYAHARNADAISKVARDAGKAKGPSDVDYRVMVETAKTMESFVEAGLRVLAIIPR